MPASVTTQTVAGAAQFDGLAGSGLFEWAEYDAIPQGSRICLTSVAYATEVGAPGDVTVYARPPAGVATARILVRRVLAADSTGPAGDADAHLGGMMLPREPTGEHWHIEATTTGKAVTGSVTVAWVYTTTPSTSAGAT